MNDNTMNSWSWPDNMKPQRIKYDLHKTEENQ